MLRAQALPSDKDAQQKLKQVDSIIQQHRFAKAIAVEATSAVPLVEQLRASLDAIRAWPRGGGSRQTPASKPTLGGLGTRIQG